MWMESKNATWEAEGQAYERVDKALAEGEQWRLANVAKGNRNRHLRRRILTSLSAGLAWLAAHAEAALLPLRGAPNGDQEQSRGTRAERSPAQSAIEAAPDAS